MQDFLAGYQNAMNKDDYLKNYATEEMKNPYIIDQAAIVSVLRKYGLGYRVGAGGGKEMAKKALRESIKTFIFLLENWGVLSRDIVRNFGTLILKAIKDFTRTKTNQSAKSNLSVEKLRSEVAIARKQDSTCNSRYYHLINGKGIGEAIFLEMDKLMNIIMDHIKYLEAQQLRNMKAESDRSPTWSKPANTNLWKIYKP